ncbi:dolichyl-phosphate-mannose--protein mannosyltransferase [Microbacterium sp. SORGH_AS_0862]|uniref:dolichyl-phosphate-mannose--protein mannosyltransferase n=1 Tax=Microbacterium sp. SORGH_AS_0862 TaxID=3041789 RepID=UPI00278ED5A2|nr:phospholipid carrier-dependent glycosyltransferase [Microbacterium sp. SORGH_AS_0862]MDQ1206363.1 dolichyl-phosphate-mannose-protein mannosyltransferase [Microbacterium sp. SORGH_AS_0862]
MTSSAPPTAPPPRRSAFDAFSDRVRGSRVLDRRLQVWTPVLLTLFAGILRFANLGTPSSLVFDETYYVKDAWSQWLLGYTANWPDGADALFAEGQVPAPLVTGSFSVHPPLGKWLIGLGMWLFGSGDSVGWRVAVATAGTLTVLVVYLIARTLTGSTAVAAIAGGLMAIDGLAIVLSRIALLDGILALFVALGFWFVLLDRRTHLERLRRALTPRDEQEPAPGWGPLLWNRPWLIAAGAAVGAATAVKWSGLYVLAALGLYVVVTDALARRRLGVVQWPADAVRQGAATFVLLVPISAIVYLASWTGWLASAGGYGRAAASEGLGGALASLWRYHEAIYAFHVGLTTPHGYQSPAWQWPLLVRPTSMYWHQSGDTVQAVSSIPNPLIWWAGIAAALYLVYRFVRTRDAQSAFVLVALAATYVPWLLYPERTIFQFYTVVMLPFLVIAIALTARRIAGSADADRRIAGQRMVTVFLVACVVLSAFWYPVWTAMPVPYEFWRLHNWLPSWV